ncbi:MAG: FkbM family methyltransferase [Syntrophales bacterium]|nr:FkbM family methyltransferase [Syntrophales bacterium]
MDNDFDNFLETAVTGGFRQALPAPGETIILYGAGGFGEKACQVLLKKGYNVAAFMDQHATSMVCKLGIPVFTPDHKAITAAMKRDIPVFIAIHNRDTDIIPIIALLIRLGYQKVFSPVRLYEICGDELGEHFWMTSSTSYGSEKGTLKECLSVWEDDISVNIFCTTLKYRITGDWRYLSKPSLGDQYLPVDIPQRWCEPIRLVDCGAFTGDTIKILLAAKLNIQALAAFEPDEDNFRQLVRFLSANGSHIQDIAMWPCAVYSSTAKRAFHAARGEASHLSPLGEQLVQCVSLDEAIPRFRSNLIKMDVEGAEYEALQGARNIIARDKPDLAICVYHRFDDLWRIPLLIRRFSDEYRLYLRLHGYNGFDLVMYALRQRI